MPRWSLAGARGPLKERLPAGAPPPAIPEPLASRPPVEVMVRGTIEVRDNYVSAAANSRFGLQETEIGNPEKG